MQLSGNVSMISIYPRFSAASFSYSWSMLKHNVRIGTEGILMSSKCMLGSITSNLRTD